MRVEYIGDATLYLGDCLEILPTLGKVDAVVTDPPYGVGLGKIKSRLGRDDGYSFEDTPENVRDVIVPRFTMALGLAKRGAVTPGHRCAWFYPAPYEIGCVYVPAGTGLGRWGFTTGHIVLFYGTDPLKRQAANSFSCNAPAEKNGHPCPKPVEWMAWLVNRASLNGETILDPFMGSGTTGVACANLGRKFIGIEIEPKYFDIACKRIETAYSQPRLFDDLEDDKSKPIEQELGFEEGV